MISFDEAYEAELAAGHNEDITWTFVDSCANLEMYISIENGLVNLVNTAAEESDEIPMTAEIVRTLANAPIYEVEEAFAEVTSEVDSTSVAEWLIETMKDCVTAFGKAVVAKTLA